MPALRIAQLVSDTEAEGPGRRFALWVQGCSLRCPGCCNPEMFSPSGGQLVEVGSLAERIASTPMIEGLSVLGGEPMEQPGPLAELCERVRAAGLSVMLYTGYRLEELRRGEDPDVARALANTDLLVDGGYEQGRPERRRRWIGSANQTLHFLSSRYSPDDPRLLAPNTIEIRLDGGKLTVNGWPRGADELRR